MQRLQGKTAVITGGGSGIGAATAKRLAGEGAQVVVADIDMAGAEAVAETISAAGGEAFAHYVDIGDETSIAQLIDAVLKNFGKLEILHNNAADTGTNQIVHDGPVDSLETEAWDRQFRINARGTMLMTRYALPALLKAGRSSIINTSSGAAMLGDLYRPAYGSSKAAINALTLYVATQYGKRGVRCNAVSPGLMLTPAVAANVPEETIKIIERHTLTPYLGKPEHIAAAVAFLASDDAEFVTGQVLVVDGGISSHFAHVADTYDDFIRQEGS